MRGRAGACADPGVLGPAPAGPRRSAQNPRRQNILVTCNDPRTMPELSTLVALFVAAVIGAVGGLFLLRSGMGGLTLMDRMYGAPNPGKLRPLAERGGSAPAADDAARR